VMSAICRLRGFNEDGVGDRRFAGTAARKPVRVVEQGEARRL
jgi:hypothetical protein